jgi:hypothetical protein
MARCRRRKNLLRYIFLRPEARTLILDWASRAQRVVAEFRAAATGYSDDPDIRRLVDELSIASSDFARCWQTQGVLAREGGERQQVSLSLAGLARLSTDDASDCTGERVVPILINRGAPVAIENRTKSC